MKRDGITLIPLAIYFNERGRAKLQLGLAKGKRKADKRAGREGARLAARQAAADAGQGLERLGEALFQFREHALEHRRR